MNKLIAVILALTLLLASGCWSKKEIEQLAFIMTIGIDKGTDSNYLISFKIAKPGGKATQEYKAADHLIFTFNSGSTGDASAELYKVLDKAPFFGQTRIVMISEEAARDGIAPILDYIGRHYRLRRNIDLIIARGKAFDLLNTQMSGGRWSAVNITTRTDNLNENTITEHITAGNFLSKLASGKIQPVVPGERKLTNQEKDIMFPKDQEEVADADLALFKQDKLVGWFTSDEAQGYMYTTGKGKRSKIRLPLADKGFVNLTLVKQDISKKVERENDQPVIKLKFTGQCIVTNVQVPAGQEIKPQDWESFVSCLKPQSEQVIQNYIEQAVAKSQALGTDVFGFAQLIFRSKPDLWREIEPNWDEIFPDLKVEVEAEMSIIRSGASTSPPFESQEERNYPGIE